MTSLTALPRRPVLLVLAAALPLATCLALAAVRAEVATAPAVLVLVVLVVAAASTGLRSAGLVAAASAAAWFDVLLTQPYGELAIHDSEDLEAMALLMVVGVAVTELSLWGRRQQARASLTSGFLDGLVVSAESVQVADRAPYDLVADTCRRITEVMGLDGCRFVTARVGVGLPQLTSTGALAGRGSSHDVDRDGLPVDSEVAVEVRAAGDVLGTFLLTSASRVTRPSRDQRRTAVLLADQMASVLLAQRRSGAAVPTSAQRSPLGAGAGRAARRDPQ